MTNAMIMVKKIVIAVVICFRVYDCVCVCLVLQSVYFRGYATCFKKFPCYIIFETANYMQKYGIFIHDHPRCMVFFHKIKVVEIMFFMCPNTERRIVF